MKIKSISISTFVILVFSGCAPALDYSAPSVAPMSTKTPKDESELSPRGNLIKKVGEVSGIYSGGDIGAKFVLNSITVDPVCTEPYPFPPMNGHYLALNFDVETFPELQNSYGYFSLSYGWKLIQPNGTTYNGFIESYSCFPPDQLLPNDFGPAEKATGYIVLDVPTTEGILVLETFDGKWEFNYPQ